MDELVDRIVAKVGVERTLAEKAVGIIFDFLSKEGPAEKVHALLDQLPGANEAIAAARAESGGVFGMGGIMGAGSRLMSAGLGTGEIQDVNPPLPRHAAQNAREEPGRHVLCA